MITVFTLLTVQVWLGAFDNLWHHEWQARLPQRAGARRELVLHAARESIYGLLFLGLAWFTWHCLWALVPAVLFLGELVITLADFIEEDRSRSLPPFERVLHALLAVGYGALLALLAPLLMRWLQAPGDLLPTSYGWFSWAFTAYGIGVLAWALRNGLAAHRLATPAVPPAQAHAQAGSPTRPAVLVAGATGFLGQQLVAQLLADDERVIAWVRDARQARASFGPGVWVVEDLDAIPPETRLRAIVQLAGAKVLGWPWTPSRRRTLVDSRLTTTAKLHALMERLEQRPEVLVAASAVGYYGATPDGGFEVRDENSSARPGEFQSDLCAAVEDAANRAHALNVRVVCLRLGIVLGRDGGAYPMLARSARLGAATVLGRGNQPMPWIHVDDALGLLCFALRQPSLQGPVNAVAPDLPTQERFTHALAASLGRRALLRVPAWPLRRVGGEMMTLLLDGQNTPARVALQAGYKFHHPSLEAALRTLSTTGARAPAQAAAAHSAIYPMTLYYDSACDLCQAEMAQLHRHDSGSLLRFIDINAPEFDAASAGAGMDDLRARIHARTADGSLLSGVPVLRLAYAATGMAWITRMLERPAIAFLADRAYPWVARMRYRLGFLAMPLRLLWIGAEQTGAGASCARDGVCTTGRDAFTRR